MKSVKMSQMFKVSQLQDEETYREALLDLLKQLPDEEEKYIYIGGTTDSSQTRFEKLSLMGALGTVASTKRTGYTLLYFLRMIIDNNYELLNSTIIDHLVDEGRDEISYSEMLDLMAVDAEGVYASCHRHKYSSLDLDDGEPVDIDPDAMNLWTKQRIQNYITTNQLSI